MNAGLQQAIKALPHKWQQTMLRRVAAEVVRGFTGHVFSLDDSLSVGIVFFAANPKCVKDKRTEMRLSAWIRKEQQTVTGTPRDPKAFALSDNVTHEDGSEVSLFEVSRVDDAFTDGKHYLKDPEEQAIRRQDREEQLEGKSDD